MKTIFILWILTVSPDGYITSSEQGDGFYGPDAETLCMAEATRRIEEANKVGKGLSAVCLPKQMQITFQI